MKTIKEGHTMKAQATPGPWDIHETDSYGLEIHTLEDENGDYPIADIPIKEYKNKEEARANAALIAAAPLMYDFVKSFAGPCHNDPGEYPEEGESGHAPCNACRANALVAKAEGVA